MILIVLAFVKCVSDVTVRGGGVSGGLPPVPPPQKMFGENGVKTCYFRQNKHGNGTFLKFRDSVYDGRRDNPLSLEVIRVEQIFTKLASGASHKNRNKINNNL